MADLRPDLNAIPAPAEAAAGPFDPPLHPDDDETNALWDLERQALLGDVAPLLALIALGLIGVFLSRVLDGLLPPQPLDPQWQLKLVDNLLGPAFLALIAVGLLLIGACLDSGRGVVRLFQRCRRWARWVCIGYLLLVPLQVHALIQFGENLDQESRKEINSLERVLFKVNRSDSVSSLNQALSQLPGSPQLPADFKGSHLPLKTDALRKLQQRINAMESEARLQKRQRQSSALRQGSKAIGATLLQSLVYCGLAMADPLKGAWLTQIFSARSRWLERSRQRRAEAFARLEELEAVSSHYEDLQAVAQPTEAKPRHEERIGEAYPVDPYYEQLAEEEAIRDGTPIQRQAASASQSSPRMKRGRRGRSNTVDAFLEQLGEEAEALEAAEAAPDAPDNGPHDQG